MAGLLQKIGLLLRRRKFDDELAEEMSFHYEQARNQLREAGLSSEEASYAAQRQFGNATRLKERSHEIAGFRFETALQDVRYALRQLAKNPGFAAIAILILTLGICASISIFAFVDAALIKPLPYPNPTRLVDVTESVPMIPHANLSYLDYLDWKKLNTVFSSLDVYTGNSFSLKTPAGTDLAPGASVSAGFFRTLGITPALGRDFYDGEDSPNGPRSVILTYAAWQKRFGGSKDVIGQTVTLSGELNTIVGVLPRSFQFAPRGDAEFWAAIHANMGCELRRSCHNLTGVARLKDGVTVQAALADTKLIAQQLEKQYPESNRGQGATVEPLSEAIIGDIRPILLVLLGGAGLLFLIACVNVASLLLVRSEGRRREMAVRSALGASRARLISQFTIEGLVLVTAGGLLGLALAGWAMELLMRLIPTDMLGEMPYLTGLGLNPHVLIFAAAISLFALVLFSLTPLVRLPWNEIREGLSSGSRAASGTMWRRFGSNLVVVELGLAMVLLVGAGLLGKSLYRLLHVDLGFEPDHLATVQTVALPKAMSDNDARVLAIRRQIIGRVSSLPGVKSVALAMQLPVSFNGNTEWIRFLDRPYHGEHNEVNQRDVSPAFFSTLKARLARGRYFTDAEESANPRVVIINQTLAKQYFPSEDPIGTKIADYDLAPNSIKVIVGVIEDIREGSLDSPAWPTVYLPEPDPDFALIARTSQDEKSVLPSIVAAVHEVDPAIAVRGESTMVDRINSSESAYLHRSTAWLVGGFAALALLLGIVGLYGVIAYSVSQRTREIGVRMALGAQRGSVYQLILSEAGYLAAFGIAAGLLCSLAAATLMRKLLFGVRSWDISTLFAVAAMLALAALLASYLPARRAASVNPTEALRAE